MAQTLDQSDRNILEIIQRDCHLKAEAIAGMVGLSASAVQRRLKRMRQEGVIEAEVAVVDRKMSTHPMTFIAGMEIERENYGALSRFRTWVEKQDYVQQVYYVTGEVDLIAIITAQDVTQYDEFTAQIMSQNPQIKRIHTNVVLKHLKLGLYTPVT